MLTRLSHSTKRNATESPLLRLPPEISNLIWTYVLGGQTLHIGLKLNRSNDDLPWLFSFCTLDDDERYKYPPCKVMGQLHNRYDQRHYDCIKSVAKAKWRQRFLALLRVCRQLHLEAALLPYLENTFAFPYVLSFREFVQSLFPAQRRSLRKVIFSGNDIRAYMRPDITSKLCGLTELTSHESVFAGSVSSVPWIGISQRLAGLPLSKLRIHVTISGYASRSERSALVGRILDLENEVLSNSKGQKATKSSSVATT